MGLLDLLGLRRPATSAPPAPAAAGATVPAGAPPAPPSAGRSDGFTVPTDGPLAAAHLEVEAFVAEAARTGSHYPPIQPKDTESGRRILSLPPEAQARVAMAAMERASSWYAERSARRGVPWWVGGLSEGLARALLRRRLPFSPADVAAMLDQAARPLSAGFFPVKSLVAQAAHLFGEPGARAVLEPPLRELAAQLQLGWSAEDRAVAKRISELLAGGETLLLEPEPWTERVIADVNALDEGERGRWVALLRHLRDAASPKASSKWLKEACRLAGEAGDDAVRERALAWLAGVREGADTPVSPRNGDLLRGLVWLLADAGGDDAARALGDLALLAARKIPNVGVRSLKALNACVAALAEMDGGEPMAQLSRLRARVKYAQGQAVIAAALRDAAGRRGMGMEELEELVVPTFGMDEPSLLREELGGWTAEVRVVGTASVETTWVRAGGKRQKTPPAELKAAHAEELKELKKTAGEMEKMLPAQRDRIEALPMAGRVVPLGDWRERYLDHPLLAPLSRRLIWRFETDGRAEAGAWLDGRLVGADDAPLAGLGADTRVSLWHPIGAGVDEVRGWREWLERHAVTQPFKQAHREVYLLTDAERRTHTYSNRFAAHILRQHQFAALAKGRGWQYQLMGWFDSYSVPTLKLPAHGLRVEYLVEAVTRDEDLAVGSGVSRYVTTDQLRFFAAPDGQGGTPLPLEQVPPLVLSEVMRDVDLFVGVASVGADPTWADRGEGAMGAYWQSYSFGELSQSAVTRREVLERLVPRLKIAKVCSLEGRFLVVRGVLRTYNIHLGSGNILMEPNDQYLCIVPDRASAEARRTQGLALPFEGDSTLSVILSKAFLLADDTKITDPTITRQIRPTR